jgi:ABC-2 type transport system ATP-binding protein
MVDHAGRRVHIAAESGTPQLSAAITALEEAGLVIDEIALRHPTLDEVFLALTTDRRDEAGHGSREVAGRP